jgi:hypothetical protein
MLPDELGVHLDIDCCSRMARCAVLWIRSAEVLGILARWDYGRLRRHAARCMQVEAIVIKEYDKYPVHLMPLTAGIIAVTYGYMPVDLNNLKIVYDNVTRILEGPDSEDFEGGR